MASRVVKGRRDSEIPEVGVRVAPEKLIAQSAGSIEWEIAGSGGPREKSSRLTSSVVGDVLGVSSRMVGFPGIGRENGWRLSTCCRPVTLG